MLVMRINGNRQFRRFAIVLGMLALLSMLFSVCLVCVETHHHCHGEDCPICACINQCRENLRHLSGGLIPAVFCLALFMTVLKISMLFIALSANETPVSLKVRLNN
jgi:hypothetical protein